MSFAWFVVGGLLGMGTMYVAAKERVWKPNPVIGAGVTEDGYTYNKAGIIQTAGKFEGQPRWVPAMWALVRKGHADTELPDGTVLLLLNDIDHLKYPELVGVYAVALFEDADGFVSAQELNKQDVEELLSEEE